MASLSFSSGLMEFLNQYKLPKDVVEGATHVTLFPQARYNVPDSAYENFLRHICSAVDAGETHCVAETPKNRMPVIANVRLVYDDIPPVSYTNQFVWRLVRMYQTILRDQLSFDDDNPIPLTCFMLEQENEEGEDYLKIDDNYVYRFQLFFPYAKVESSFLNKTVKPLLLAQIRSQNMVKYLDREPINSWEDAIDFNIAQNPFLMYGGVENRNSRPLFVTRCYHAIKLEDIDDNTVIDWLQEEDGNGPIDIRLETYSGVKLCIVSPALFDENPDKWHWLPVFFSLSFTAEVSVMKEQSRYVAANPNVPWSFATGFEEVQQKLEVIEQQLLPMLRPNRFSVPSYWLDIGKGLFHACNGDAYGLEVWKKVGQRRGVDIDTFGGGNCDYHWATYDDYGTDGITDLTIRWYAQRDNPEQYRQWRTEMESGLFDAATSCTDDDVAKAFHFRFPFEFLYAGRQWWRFQGHRWGVDDEGIGIITHLAENFTKALESHRTNLSARAERVAGFEKQDIDRRLKQLGQLLTKLKSDPFKHRITNSLRRHYLNKTFDSNKDENPRLTVCKNGIIEACRDGSIFFRDGKPEDYCTKWTNIKYPLTKPENTLKELNVWLAQLFIDPAAPEDLSYHKWMAYYRASLLCGGNKEKLMLQMFGETHTAKSLYEKALFCMLGEYAGKGENSDIIFNSQKSPGSAAPFLARAQGTRLLFYDELDSKTPLDAGAIRKQSGGDTQPHRDLFQKGRDIVESRQQFRIACTYNKEPPINDASVDAFWERIAVAPFTTKWSFTAPRDPEEQKRLRIYARDMEFEDRIKHLAPAMLWLAVEDYPKYFREGLPLCDKIIKATRNYRAHSDYYLNFINNALRTNPTSVVTLRRMYNHFRSWYIGRFPNSKPPSDPFFQREMASKHIGLIGNEYHGYELVAEEPEPARLT